MRYLLSDYIVSVVRKQRVDASWDSACFLQDPSPWSGLINNIFRVHLPRQWIPSQSGNSVTYMPGGLSTSKVRRVKLTSGPLTQTPPKVPAASDAMGRATLL